MNTVDARPDDDLELTDYLRILRRRWPWLLLVVVLVVGAATAFTVVQEPRYSAAAQVSLGNSAAQDAVLGGGLVNVPTASRELSNELNLAASDQVRIQVTEELGTLPDVEVTAEDSSDAIRFTATSSDPEQAADEANTWAQVYVDTKRDEATTSIEAAIEGFEADLAALRAQRQELREPLDRAEDQLALAETPEERVVLQGEVDRLRDDLAPELDLLDVRVQALAQNITNLEVTSRLAATGTARIVQVAAPPQQPVNAPLSRNVFLGAIVGLIVGAAVALLVENLDRTVKTTEDLTALGIPVLGAIPAPGRQIPSSELALATMRHTGTPTAEGYQKVRTAVEFALLGRKINSLLVTSPNQAEGKTTLSTNLAWAMSAIDHRVALVDVDFRRPRIHEVYQCSPYPGLSDNLLSGTPINQLALRVDEGGSRNLIVIPTGTQPPSPGDFVASPPFASLIRYLENEADLVILDAPPVLPVSDALSISRQVDAVVLVAKAGETTRERLVDTYESLRQIGADVLGVCLVGVHGKAGGYGTYGEPPARNGRTRGHDVIDMREGAATPKEPEGFQGAAPPAPTPS